MQNSRRKILLTSTSIILWGMRSPAFAVDDKKLAERYYSDALTMLKNGHWYQRAIDKLSYCVKVSPANSTYRLALGSAYASRLASYCVAYRKRERESLSATEMKALFNDYRRKNLGDFEPSTEKDIESFLSSLPQDSVPNVIVLKTPDDNNRPSVYDRKSLVERLRRLSECAGEFWETALSTCKTREETKSALKARIWGTKLLILSHLYIKSLGLSEPYSEKQVQSWQEIMLSATEELVSVFPEEADSWSLRGEALSRHNEIIWSSSGEEIKIAYQKALHRSPDNPAVLFRLYQIEQSKKVPPSEAESYLRRFVKMQNGNAYAHFCLAGHLANNLSTEVSSKSLDENLEKQKIDEIIRVVYQGVASSSYRTAPNCAEPIDTLRLAYSYLGALNSPSATFRREFSSVGQVLLNFARRQPKTQIGYAKKCCYTALAMSKRTLIALGNGTEAIPVSDPCERLLEILMEGQARNTYKTLLTILQKGEDETERSSLEQEQKAFITATRAKRKSYH